MILKKKARTPGISQDPSHLLCMVIYNHFMFRKQLLAGHGDALP